MKELTDQLSLKTLSIQELSQNLRICQQETESIKQ